METFSRAEVRLALRNREMPLEALALEVTPTGMHYLLSHFDIPMVDPSTWRLEIGGLVERPTSLGLEELRRLPATTEPVTLECAGNGRSLMTPRHEGQPWHLGGVSTARWTGVRLADLLVEVGVRDGAVDVAFTGADEGIEEGVRQAYAWGLPIAEALRTDLLLAFEMNGRLLEPQHGAPLRLVVPGWYGMASVKWLTRIEVLAAPFDGPQPASYRTVQREDDTGEPISRIGPRALMIPPGVADDDDEQLARVVDADILRLTGRAWSGLGPIERVEVSADGGVTWIDAALGTPPGPAAWVSWNAEVSLAGSAERHELCARATDASGATQPDAPVWNLWGYVNDAIQRVAVRRA